MKSYPSFVRRRRAAEDSRRVEQFATIGWTEADWHLLYDDFQVRKAADPDSDDAHNLNEVLRWLESPTYFFTTETRITPDTVRDALRYEDGAVAALNGYIVGAPQPFVEFLLTMPRLCGSAFPNVRATWQSMRHLHLGEHAAIGWAATGLFTNMFNRFNPPHEEDNIVAGVADWVDRFGQDAWLWVLAGFDLEEATDLVVAGGGLVPDRQQLRVMAALNGADLPAGI